MMTVKKLMTTEHNIDGYLASVTLMVALLAFTLMYFDFDFIYKTIIIGFIVSMSLLFIELLHKRLIRPKICIENSSRGVESLNNVFIYLLRSIASQFSAYVLSLIAIVIAATLVPVSAKLYSGDVSDITLFNRNFILIGFFIFECIALLIVIATGGWVRFLQILDEEFDFKSFGFGIIVATFAIPSIANTVTSTGKMDLMFKLVALGIMFFFIHLHKKWLEKDIYTSEDIKSLRKFFVIIQMLIMYCCCYYQIVHLSVVDANKSTSVHDEYICTNTTKSFFPLRCEKVNYIYLQ